jgi:hypothetical protein
MSDYGQLSGHDPAAEEEADNTPPAKAKAADPKPDNPPAPGTPT